MHRVRVRIILLISKSVWTSLGTGLVWVGGLVAELSLLRIGAIGISAILSVVAFH